MKDEIFWGNLKGLLKQGRWSLNLEEATALLAVYKEAVDRSNPLALTVQNPEPIKPNKSGKKK